MLTKQDEQDLIKRGKSLEETEKQLEMIARGFAPAAVRRPATIGDGIIKVSDDEAKALAEQYDAQLANGLNVAKFVPASGAASRMFKPLHQFLGAAPEEQGKLAAEEPMSTFFGRLDDFAFAGQLKSFAPQSKPETVSLVLADSGLAYGTYPKGLVAFHKYPDGTIRTAAEEHLAEAEAYCLAGGKSHVHYTVPVGMEPAFRKTLAPMLAKLNSDIEVTYSVQPPATDVPALTLDGKPARDKEGHLIFRPGGHGALIGNLGNIDADVVFVKNIDNVAHGRILPDSAIWKKVIGAHGLNLKAQIDNILRRIDSGDAKAVDEALQLIDKTFKAQAPANADKREFAIKFLDRPLRVCGMVKNEGELGGGPFWVEGKDGILSLQIVESAQMNLDDPKVKEIFNGSTHFNPVDLFCCLKDRNGKRYNLADFVDPEAGFQTHKSVNGIDVTGMELPGLWNGAMAKWLTIFVEVPVITFTPVKTVMDLLRPVHQPK
ncbi:MAG: DUF4301 family protein [Bacteroidales bacterium]|nr:DUF4301 family protein [Bacteroidales bacterium]